MTINNKNNSIYKCSKELEEDGYKYDNYGLFCPLVDNYYLQIARGDEKYNYSLAEYKNNTFKVITQNYTYKEPITEYKNIRNQKLKKEWKKLGNTTNIIPMLSTIATKLNNEVNYTQITKNFDEYNKKETESEDFSEIIEKRRNPILTDSQKKEAEEIEEKIQKEGLVEYLNGNLDKLQEGSHKNIIIKLLMGFKIMLGELCIISEEVADKEEGKSHEDKIAFEMIIPQEYIYKVNSITKSSFTRYAEKNEYYFDRKILLFGDFGDADSFKEMEDLLNIFKILITEKEYVRDLSDRNSNGQYENKQLKLKVDSIGGAYSTLHNSFTNGDGQLESRTISFTPPDVTNDEVMDYMYYTDWEDTELSKEVLGAKKELEHFQSYLLSLVNKELKIINPYNTIFKKYAKKSSSPRREYKKIRSLFNSYCKLTHFDCDNVDGRLVASKKQVNEFMQEIYFENALIPYENAFLKMLIAKGKKTKLTIIDADSDENTLDKYYTNVIEKLPTELKIKTIYDIDSDNEEKFVKKLLELYGLNGTSSNHEKNVFFRVSDIRRTYKNLKAYKNIEDVSTLIYALLKKGYINSTGYKSKTQNIYYLNRECNNISLAFELGEEDEKERQKFLQEIGIMD